jgi:hypothetical protein
MEAYTDEAGPVNPVELEIEIPRFIPPRCKQAATAKPRRRLAPSVWSAVRAYLAREHQRLPPDSPRVRPTLPRLRLREPA